MRNVVTRGRFSFQATLEQVGEPEEPPPVVVAENSTTAPVLNRKQRRRTKAFNRLLQARFAKDNLPAKVDLLPDGGIHITIKKPEEPPAK